MKPTQAKNYLAKNINKTHKNYEKFVSAIYFSH